MARIFISYSRSDVTFARDLTANLSDLGADVWLDVDDIPAGENWGRAIQQGLDSSDVMIVVISPDSMASTNVENEWQYFLDQGHPVIPVLWRPAKVHFQLHRLQYIDFHTQDFDKALRQLHSELRRKGVSLAPISAQLSTQNIGVPIPAQPALPRRGERFPRSVVVSAAVMIALVIVAIILALSGVLGGGDEPNEDEIVTQADDHLLTQTVVVLMTPRLSPTDTPNPTSTPEPTATYTLEPTNMPEPTAIDTLEPLNTPYPTETPTFIPAGSRNSDWTPII
jgi:hypothetical protein